MSLMFIIDTDTDRALALFESIDGAEKARAALEPAPTRNGGGVNGWRFSQEGYYQANDCRPDCAELTKRRLRELGLRFA